MRKNQAAKTFLVITLMVALVMGILPVQALQLASVSAEQTEHVTLDDLSWTLEEAKVLSDAGNVLSSGEWQYVLLPDAGYAVITGHTGTQSVTLSVPDTLGGADVVALAAGALADHTVLESIALHGNVFVVGDRAIPRGVTIRGLNASYAQTYASKKGYAFEREAEFDLRSGVVDLADVRAQNITRVSQYEVEIRALEARRLSVGKHFFYIDPNNAYQVSFYTVSAMSDMGNGFVRVSCTTPDVDSVLRSYSGVNEELMLDMNSVKLYDGARINTGGNSRVTLGPFKMPEIEFDTKKLKNAIKIDGFALSAYASIKPSYKATFTGGLFSKKTVKIVEEREVTMNGSLSYEEKFGAVSDETKKEIKRLSEYAKTYAGKRGISKTMRSHTIPLGGGIVFSYAGILNVDVSWGLTFELNGSIGFSYSATLRTTYTWDEENKENIGRKSETFNETSTMSAKASLKVGGTVSLNVRIVALRIFSVGLFFGVQAELEYKIDDSVSIPNVNMLDCMTLKVTLLVEGVITLGDELTMEGSAFGSKLPSIEPKKLLEHDLAVCHFHFCEKEIVDNGEYFEEGKTRGFPQHFHLEDDCPYDMKYLKVALPWMEGGSTVVYQSPNKYLDSQKILINLTDGEGNAIYEPEMKKDPGNYLELDVPIDHWADYERRLDSVHTDMSLDKESEVEAWPHKLGDGPTLYLNAVPLYDATLMYSDGTKIVEKYAEGERVDLTQFGNDGLVLYWTRIESEQDLTVLERIDRSVLQVFDYEMPAEDAWFHAVCANDIELEFYLGNGETYNAFAPGEVGALIEAPSITPTLPRYAFDGWKDAIGQRVSFPLEVTEELIKQKKVVFEAIWKETDEITAEDLEDCGVGAAIVRPDGYFNVDENSLDYLNYNTVNDVVTIIGLKDSAPENLNLKIPATIKSEGNECIVTAIAANAFAGNTKLRSVEIPYTVTSIGKAAFGGCTNLELLHMAACRDLQLLPESMTSGCTKLECVLLPKGIITATRSSCLRRNRRRRATCSAAGTRIRITPWRGQAA